jgi:hypothetical protein
MPQNAVPWLVTQAPDPALALRRQMLVSSLFKYVAEIEEIEGGYAFKFRRRELLIQRIAEYIVFEGQHSPHLMFVLVSKPNDGAVWPTGTRIGKREGTHSDRLHGPPHACELSRVKSED